MSTLHGTKQAGGVPRAYREWQIGIALFALGNIFNFISFGKELAHLNRGEVVGVAVGHASSIPQSAALHLPCCYFGSQPHLL